MSESDLSRRTIADLQAKLAAYDPVIQAAIAVSEARRKKLYAAAREDKHVQSCALHNFVVASRHLDLAVFALKNPHVAPQVIDLIRQSIDEDSGKGEESDE